MKKAKKPKVSVIVCAYNEEKNLRQTLSDLVKCPTAEEIIVVNDGSTDQTLQIIKEFKPQVKIISYRKNKGKGYALSRGIKAAQGKVVVFLDAHLKNLKDHHLKQLSQPILKRKTNYVISQCARDLSGQRAYLKELILPHLSHLQKSRFGVETYLNVFFKPNWGKRVILKGLVHLIKHEVMPASEILPAYIQEAIEISKTKLEIQVNQHRQLEKILNPKKIKTVKAFQKKIEEIKDKEVSGLIKKYILPYLRKVTQ